MFLISLVCWAIWGVVLNQIDPFAAGVLGLVFFYLSLSFALTTGFAVLGLIIRRFFIRQEAAVIQVGRALRQGVLFAALIVGALILSNLNLLNWLNVVLLVAVLAVLEFFFLSAKNKNEMEN